jgi:tetratricopeptide (TPR) repeat protein
MRQTFLRQSFLVLFGIAMVMGTSFADEKTDGLLKDGKYADVIQYVEKIAPAERAADQWVALATAYRKTGASSEKVMVAIKEAQKANPSDPGVYLAMGTIDFEAGKYPTALESFQKCYLLNRTAEAAEGIARSAAKLNQWDKARDAAESAVSLDGNVLESRMILCELAMKKNDYKSAAAQLEFIVQKRVGVIDYWKQLSSCYEKLGEKEKLAQSDQKIVDLDKKDVASRRRLVEYSMAKKDSSAAFGLCKELAILTPQDPKVFSYLYQIAYSKGNKKDAILYLKNYLVLDSSAAQPYKLLGELLYEQHDADGALDAYRHALRKDPQAKGFYKHYEELVLQKNLEPEAVRVIQGAIAAGEADAQSYIALGNIYKKQKDYAAAAKMYQQALKTETNNVEVLTSLAECQATAGDANGAIITYEQVVLMNPKATREYKQLGDLNMKIGKKESGISAYQKFLTKVPEDADVARTVGLYQYEKSQWAEAIKYLNMVKDTAEYDVTYLTALGDCYANTGDQKMAAKLFAKVRTKNPSDAVLKKILKPLAAAYENMGDDAKAADAYEAYTKIPGVKDPDAAYKKAFLREKSNKQAAVKLYEGNTKAYPQDYRNFLRLGMMYSEDKGSQDAAAAMLRATAQLVDSLPQVWLKLGEIYSNLKDEEKELAAYKKLLTLEAGNLEANRRVGMILLKKKQLPQAIANLEMALTMAPKDVEIMRLLADAYVDTKRPKQAIDLLAKAKAIDSNNGELRMQLYQLYKETGDDKNAETEIKGLIDLKKENKYRLMYVKDLVSQKRYEEAKGQVKVVIASDFMNVEALMLQAKIQTALNQLDDAIETYKNVLYIDEKYAPALASRGGIYIVRGDYDLAKTYFEKALASNPRLAGAEVGLARISKAQKNMGGYQEHLNKAKALDPRDPDVLDETKDTKAK